MQLFNADFQENLSDPITHGTNHGTNHETFAKAHQLKKLSDDQICSGLATAIGNEKKATHLVLAYILEVEARHLHAKLGFANMFQFLTEHHKYSGNQAYDRINAAKVLRVQPTVLQKVEEGSLNLTQLMKVGQCLKQDAKAGREVHPEKTAEILSQMENKSIFESEKLLSVELNFTPKKQQKVKPQRDDSVWVEMTLTAAQFEMIKKVQSFVSHSVPNNDLAEAFVFFAKQIVLRQEGRDRRSHRKPTNRESKTAKSNQIQKSRQYISLRVRRKLLKDANYSCTHIESDTGKKCTSNFCLQVDHIQPIAMGGSSNIENLRVLCGFHNRLRAAKSGLRFREEKARAKRTSGDNLKD